MDSEMRKKIIDNLINAGVVKTWYENVVEGNGDNSSSPQTISSDDMDVASDGTPYVKSAVFQYLRNEGLPFTQEYIDLTARMLHNSNIAVGYSNTRKVLKNELENVDDEALLAYISSKTVELLAKQNEVFMEYDVVCIRDRSTGSENMGDLIESIQKHSELGWRIKSIFTNELGVNSSTTSFGKSTGGINVRTSVGTNATIEQTIIIYERPLSIDDETARKIYNKLTRRR